MFNENFFVDSLVFFGIFGVNSLFGVGVNDRLFFCKGFIDEDFVIIIGVCVEFFKVGFVSINYGFVLIFNKMNDDVVWFFFVWIKDFLIFLEFFYLGNLVK